MSVADRRKTREKEILRRCENFKYTKTMKNEPASDITLDIADNAAI